MRSYRALPLGASRLSGSGIEFEVFVRPSGLALVDETHLRALRRHMRQQIGTGIKRMQRIRRTQFFTIAIALTMAAVWAAMAKPLAAKIVVKPGHCTST